ncbi:hypothetical protein B0H14DRAFT_3467853 [Mycena olivaceomarginata]|nr:hypothetical protein B0H14DRAFT_3467853 [Mycena olivaceomarginata]
MMGADADLEEALRIEWCKAYARTRRWREEMLLVEEEVRRAGVTLEFWAGEWDRRAMVPIGESQWEEWNRVSDGLAGWAYERVEGAVAYALKQATIFRDIAAHLTVSMTEVRQGRGKHRLVYDDEWVDREGNGAAGISEGGADEEQELEDLRRDEVADDDFILGGEGSLSRPTIWAMREGRAGREGKARVAAAAVGLSCRGRGWAKGGWASQGRVCPTLLTTPSSRPTPTLEQGSGGGGEHPRARPWECKSSGASCVSSAAVGAVREVGPAGVRKRRGRVARAEASKRTARAMGKLLGLPKRSRPALECA